MNQDKIELLTLSWWEAFGTRSRKLTLPLLVSHAERKPERVCSAIATHLAEDPGERLLDYIRNGTGRSRTRVIASGLGGATPRETAVIYLAELQPRPTLQRDIWADYARWCVGRGGVPCQLTELWDVAKRFGVTRSGSRVNLTWSHGPVLMGPGR